jgi:hypothetical protein
MSHRAAVEKQQIPGRLAGGIPSLDTRPSTQQRLSEPEVLRKHEGRVARLAYGIDVGHVVYEILHQGHLLHAILVKNS